MKGISNSSIIAVSVLGVASILVVATAVQPWIDPMRLYYDVQTLGRVSENCCSAYDGAISTLGIMLWASTAALAMFAGFIFYIIDDRAELGFALHVGLLSGWLAIDDAYLLHELVLPRLGVPQLFVLASIGFALFMLLIVHRSILLRAAWWLLAFAVLMFAISASVDIIMPGVTSTWLVVEDGSKFIGIVAWCVFFVDTFLKLALKHLTPITDMIDGDR